MAILQQFKLFLRLIYIFNVHLWVYITFLMVTLHVRDGFSSFLLRLSSLLSRWQPAAIHHIFKRASHNAAHLKEGDWQIGKVLRKSAPWGKAIGTGVWASGKAGWQDGCLGTSDIRKGFFLTHGGSRGQNQDQESQGEGWGGDYSSGTKHAAFLKAPSVILRQRPRTLWGCLPLTSHTSLHHGQLRVRISYPHH